MTAKEAAGRVRKAADELHAAFYPGDELRGAREDVDSRAVEAADRIIALLNEAEDLLDPGIGEPQAAEGLAKVNEARDVLERFLAVSMLGGIHELVRARADALRQMDAILG